MQSVISHTVTGASQAAWTWRATLYALLASFTMFLTAGNCQAQKIIDSKKVVSLDGRWYKDDRPVTGRIVEFSETGSILLEMDVVDGMRHGIYKEYYPNGAQKIDAHYLQGNLEALHVEYYQDSLPFIRTMFRSGIRNGLEEIFHPNGKLQRSIEYADGVIADGRYEEFDVEGEVINEKEYHVGVLVRYTPYRENVANGKSVEYFTNGRVRSEVLYDRGARTGVHSEYDSTGVLFRTTQYVDGKRDGESLTFPEAGKLERIDQFQNDTLRSFFLLSYDDDGRLREKSQHSADGKRNGSAETYWQDGSVFRRSLFVDDTETEILYLNDNDPDLLLEKLFDPTIDVIATAPRTSGSDNATILVEFSDTAVSDREKLIQEAIKQALFNSGRLKHYKGPLNIQPDMILHVEDLAVLILPIDESPRSRLVKAQVSFDIRAQDLRSSDVTSQAVHYSSYPCGNEETALNAALRQDGLSAQIDGSIIALVPISARIARIESRSGTIARTVVIDVGSDLGIRDSMELLAWVTPQGASEHTLCQLMVQRILGLNTALCKVVEGGDLINSDASGLSFVTIVRE